MTPDINRLDHLLKGAIPSLEDYALFVSVAEKLPPDMLLRLTQFEGLNHTLKAVSAKVLQEKIGRINIDNSLAVIAEKFRAYLGNR